MTAERCRWRPATGTEPRALESPFRGFDLHVFPEGAGWGVIIRHEGWLAYHTHGRPSLAAAKRWARGVAANHADDLRASARAAKREQQPPELTRADVERALAKSGEWANELHDSLRAQFQPGDRPLRLR